VPFSITRFFARSVLNLVVVGWSPTVGVCPNAFKMEDVETDDMDESLIPSFSIEKVTRSHCLRYYCVHCLQFPSESGRNRITSFVRIIRGPIISLTAGVSRAGART